MYHLQTGRGADLNTVDTAAGKELPGFLKASRVNTSHVWEKLSVDGKDSDFSDYVSKGVGNLAVWGQICIFARFM